MSEITLLDGGMGQELVHRAGDRPTPLWSTQVMIDHPGMVAGVHRDFADAGATIATANSYAIHRDRLEGTGFEDRFSDLHALALAEARNSGAARIAASIGPLGASYQADIHPEVAVAAKLYAEVAAQWQGKCDLIICETVVSVRHAESLLAGLEGLDVPIWMAFSVTDQDGTQLRSGEPLADAVAVAAPHVQAVLINCTTPEVIPAGLDVLAKAGLPYGAYANGFERITEGFLGDKPTVDALRMRWDFTPEAYAEHALKWVDAGATIVGGCCEVSPAHIAEIANRLRASGHTIV
ncbi:MAG: homocysteine S-methyltransferase family protein [Sulfitobacter sp.]